jgi:hypothetical protein
LFSRAQAFHKIGKVVVILNQTAGVTQSSRWLKLEYSLIEKTAIVKEKIFCYWTLPDCWFNMM